MGSFMDLLTKYENYELDLSMNYDTAFDVIRNAANTLGKIQVENKTLKVLHFKTRMNLSRNAVKFIIKFEPKDENSTILKIETSCLDGVVGLDSINRTYNKFLELIE